MAEAQDTPVIQRLKQFIASTGLSSTQFADKAMISRPTLSQLLHGRSKSINNQILSKLYENFPSLDILWLLFGQGSMTNDFPEELSDTQEISDDVDGSIDSGDTMSINDTAAAQDPPEPSQGHHETFEQVLAAKRAIDVARTGSLAHPQTRKEISSIIVLYNDGSFERFVAH